MGRLEDEIKHFSRIAIDTNAFIYLMERHPKYFDVVRELFNAVEIGKVYAVSSMLLVTEVLTKPLKDGNKGLADQYLAFVGTFPNLGLREIDQNVAIRAANLELVMVSKLRMHCFSPQPWKKKRKRSLQMMFDYK